MNLDAARELLKKTNGIGTYEVFIPTLKKTIPFLQMTTGQRKTISKLAIEYGIDMLEYQFIKLGVIAELCLDKTINVETLSDIDFLSILSSIRKNNVLTPLELSFKCEKCQKDNKFTVDFSSIEDKCKSFETKNILISTISNGIKVSMILSDPSILSVLSYNQFLIKLLDLKKDTETLETDLNHHQLLNYPIQFIKDILINDEIIDDFKTMNFFEKVKFLDESIPSDLIFNEKDGLVVTAYGNFKENRLDSVFQEVKCEQCGDIKEGAISLDSFFII